MTKSQLVERVAAATQESTENCQKAVDAVFSFLERPLSKGESFQVRGFGSFRVAWRKLREVRNPKTGKLFFVRAQVVRVFKPSKQLTERVNVSAFPSQAKFGLDLLK